MKKLFAPSTEVAAYTALALSLVNFGLLIVVFAIALVCLVGVANG